MEEHSMSELESLKLIDTMINKARNRFSENGHLYLVWGWSILLLTLLHFMLDYFQLYNKPNMVWVLTFLPWAYMMIYLRRKGRREVVRTYTDEIAGYVWLVFAALMFLFGFILGSKGAYTAIYPACLALYGMPTFLSGIILRFRPLVAGGVSCWLLSLASLTVQSQFQILFLTLAVILAWIVPGYLLQHRHQSLQKAS
jgi:hypothetical protein